MSLRKSVALVASCVLIATTSAHAGGLAEPLMAPEVIAEEAVAESRGFILPLILLVLIAAAISSGGGGGGGGGDF